MILLSAVSDKRIKLNYAPTIMYNKNFISVIRNKEYFS